MSTEFFNDQWRIPSNENQNKVSNYSMKFDGSSTLIDLGSTLGDIGTSTTTFSFWLNIPTSTSHRTVLSNRGSGGGWAIDMFDVSGQYILSFFNASSSTSIRCNFNDFNTWAHIVIVRDGISNNKIYINGVSQTLTSNNENLTNIISSKTLTIGAQDPLGTGYYRFLNGQIDQLSIFDYELSQDQVTQLGLDGYAFNFDGIDDRLNCGNDSSLQITGAMTISCWVKGASTQGASGVSTFDSINSPGYIFGPNSSGLVSFILADTGSSYISVDSTQQITTTEWHHIVGVYTPSVSMKIYIDGQLSKNETSNIPSSQYAGGNDFVIGYRPCCKIDGQISNVAIWNTDLTGTQVSTLYNNGKPGDISSLNPVAWYKLDNSELFNGAEWSIDNSKYPSVYKSSLDFSGNNQYLQVPDSNDFSFGNGTTDSPFSLSAWVNPDAVEFAGIVAKYVSGIYEWLFYLTDSNELRLQLQSNNGTANSINLTTDVAIPTNTWTHVSATYNANGLPSGIDLYINGLPQSLVTEGGSGTYQAMTNTTAPLQIGTWAGSFRPINGQVSNVSIWDAELTQAQVSEIYNNGTPSNLSSHSATSNLISWWELDNTTTGLQDSKGSNNASNIGTTKYDGFVNTLAGESEGMTSSNLVISDINGELIVNPMITSPKPIAYYQLGDQSVDNGANLLVPNNSLSDYVFDFDGNNDYIDFGDVNNFDRTDAFSASCWVNLTGSDNEFILSKQDSSTFKGYLLYVNVSRYLILYIASSATNRILIRTNSTVSNNAWTHLAFTYDGSSTSAGVKLYFNGVNQSLTNLGNTSITGSLLDSNVPFQISGRDRSGASGVNGKLSNVSIFSTDLSSPQVETLYNNGSPSTDISSLSPVAWYKLDSSEVFNSTSTEWSVDNNAYPSVYKSSLNFDGSSDYIDTNSTFNTLTSFTVSAWFKADDTAGAAQGIASTRVNSIATSKGFDIFINSNVLTGRVYNNGATEILQSFTDTTSWHNVVMTYNGTTLELFLDNSSIGTATGNYDNSGGRNLTIGKWGPVSATPYYFDGQISNVAIWNTDLSSLEINTLYNNGTPEASISHSPVSWWKLNNTTTGIQDSAGSNNGTNNGATEYVGFVNELAGESLGMNSANLVVSDLQQTSGYSPYALDFDGADDYLNTGNHSIFQITGAMTVSYWFNGQGGSGTVGGFGKLGGSNNRGFCLGLNNNNNITFYIAPTINSLVAATYSHTADNNWHHLLGVFTPSTSLELYFDGVLVATTSTSVSSQYNGSNNLQIGARGDNLGTFNGKISNAAIWNTSLTFTEVTEIYNQGVPSNLNTFSGTAPISWWQLGSNSSYNSGLWTCLNEIGDKNFQSAGNMTNSDIVDGPGYSASGLGTSSIDIKGDAPYSTANGLSENMDVLDRTLDTPIVNTHSIQLDGVDGAYVDFGNVNIFERTDAFSGSCWINLASSASTGMFISKSKNSTIVGYQFYVTATRDIIFFIGDFYSNNYLLARTVNSINASTWYNVAFTYSGSSARTGIKLYVNGVAQSLSYQGPTSITGSIVDSSVPFQISGRDGANLVLDGKIDEVAMFNSELSAPQVASIYNNGTPNNILPLNPVSWHRFESLTTNGGVVTTADSSVNGLTGTVENGAVLSTIVP